MIGTGVANVKAGHTRASAEGHSLVYPSDRIVATGLQIVPKCMGEWTFAWISRNRRLTRDFVRYVRIVAAFVRGAMICLMFFKRQPSPILAMNSSRLG